MITIKHEGTDLIVAVNIPGRLNDWKTEHFACRATLGGSPIAVAALAEDLSHQLDCLIQNIRKEAYLQGVKDRAKRAINFDTEMEANLWKGGCWR